MQHYFLISIELKKLNIWNLVMAVTVMRAYQVVVSAYRESAVTLERGRLVWEIRFAKINWWREEGRGAGNGREGDAHRRAARLGEEDQQQRYNDLVSRA